MTALAKTDLTEYRDARTKAIDDTVRSIRAGDADGLRKALAGAREAGVPLQPEDIQEALILDRMPRMARIIKSIPKTLRPGLIATYRAVLDDDGEEEGDEAT